MKTIKIEDQVISIVSDNWDTKKLNSSQRAWYELQRLFRLLDREVKEELEEKIINLETQREWATKIKNFFRKLFWKNEISLTKTYTKNTFKNILISILFEENEKEIKQADKYEDKFHTLSKIYWFWSQYINWLENFKSDKPIWFTTKRNIFLKLYL